MSESTRSTIKSLLSNLHQQKRHAEAEADGYYHAQRQIAKALLTDGINIDQIQQFTELERYEIKRIESQASSVREDLPVLHEATEPYRQAYRQAQYQIATRMLTSALTATQIASYTQLPTTEFCHTASEGADYDQT